MRTAIVRAALVVGDWVQAQVEITETTWNGVTIWVASKGGIGHVWEIDGDTLNVTWERSGITSVVDISEVEFLCHADAGKDFSGKK